MTDATVVAGGLGKSFGLATALEGVYLGGPTTRLVTDAAAWLTALPAITIPVAVTRRRYATGS